MKTKLEFKTLPQSYQEMMRFHLLRPIHDKVELGNALEILDALAGHDLNREQEDYFDALSTLVEAYEREHVPAPRRQEIDLLRHLLDANAMNAADLARLLGRDRSLGVRMLRGERKLTINHIKILAQHFGLSPTVFLQ